LANQSKARADAYYQGALILSLLVGIAFRVYHLFIIGFEVPFNLGGLFYQMSTEIIKNGFLLPASIPYYFPGGLPFAYPPLPFYIQAIIIKLFSPSPFFTVNALPPFFSILSLVAFCFLAQKVIQQKAGVVGAVFTFSIIPIAFSEQIEAMGLAESAGTLFLTLYLLSLVWAINAQQKIQWIVPGISLGLCILSSPGSIYASTLISILLLGISIKRILVEKDFSLLTGCFITGAVGLMASSPYWLNVIAHHGIGIYFNTFSAQNSNLLQLFATRAQELQLIQASPYWNILFLFGFLSAFIKRQYLLILFSMAFMLMPREFWIMSIPASLLAGYGIITLLDLLSSIPIANTNHLKVAVIWTMILFFVIDSSFSLRYMIDDVSYDISETQINELTQINRLNLIPEDEFVVASGNWGLIEWSPAILERTVINNPFGLEWLPDRNRVILHLNETLPQSNDPDSILSGIREAFNGINQVYIIANKSQLDELDNAPGGKTAVFETIQEFEDLGVGLLTVLK